MNCPYATQLSAHVNQCSLGLNGGNPSKGVCARCIDRRENTPEHAAKIKATPPSLPKQAATLVKALVNWTTSGFAATPPEALAAREATCRECAEWNPTAIGGTGRCAKCGCATWAKLRMATERCPLGKWESLTHTPQ